jgi:hypothetical protein
MRLPAAFFALALAAPLAALAEPAMPTGTVHYDLGATQGKIKVVKGQGALAHISVQPKPGAHVSPDAPLTVQLAGGANLILPKVKIGREGAVANAAQGVEIDLPFSGKEKGADELKATLTFYICHAELCERQQKLFTFPVSIE